MRQMSPTGTVYSPAQRVCDRLLLESRPREGDGSTMTSSQIVSDELNRFVQSNVASALTEFIKDGTLDGFMANSDLWALGRLMGPESGRDPVGLFWNLYGDGKGFHVRELFPGNADEWDEIVLASLEFMHQHCRVPYQPDEDFLVRDIEPETADWPPTIVAAKLENLVTSLHIAASLAFTIKRLQSGGLDETALDCLNEVVRTLKRLYALGLSDLIDQNPTQAFLLSSNAVASKCYAELGRISNREGNYSEALNHFAEAAFNASYAAERFIAEGGDVARPNDLEPVPLRPSGDLTCHIVQSGLDNLTADEIVGTFLNLKASKENADWSEVARDCRVLLSESARAFGAEPDSYIRTVDGDAVYVTEWVPNDPAEVANETGEHLSWREFWYVAREWATAQMSPNEYRKLRDDDENNSSERRLKTYFFDPFWSELPDRAKNRLIAADTLWNAQGRMAWDAVLSNLQIAAEEMFLKFVFQPMKGSVPTIDQQLLGLLEGIEHSREHSKIFYFADVCRNPSFEGFLKRRKIETTDIEFLTRELPGKLDRLRSRRNSAEHATEEACRREEISPFFHEFMGIGQRGVLPELARIGRSLRM